MTTPGKDAGVEEEVLEETSLISHLVELRDRLIRASLAVIAVLVCLVPFAEQIFTDRCATADRRTAGRFANDRDPGRVTVSYSF